MVKNGGVDMKTLSLICLLAASVCVLCASALKVVSPPGATIVGPYSPGIVAGDLLFVSGQGAQNATGKFADSIEQQVDDALNNVKTIVEAAGLTMEHVVFTGFYLKDVTQYDKLAGPWKKHFPKAPPARATIGVYRMPGDTPVEISAVAVRDLKLKTIVNPPGWRLGISAGVMAGDRLYLSGFTGRDPETGVIPKDPAEQVEVALARMKAALTAGGLDFRHVVFVNPYLTAAMPMETMNRVYAKHFEFGDTPARATIQVSALPRGTNIELAGVAVRDPSQRRAVRPRNMPPSATASPCVWAGDTLFCSAKSGFIPGPNSGIYAASVQHQVRQTMRNLLDGLEEAGLGFNDVVATNVYLDNIDDFADLNTVYAEYFPQTKPTRTTVAPASPVDRRADTRGRWPKLEEISLVAVRTAPQIVTFSDDGGWCWFEDERVIVAGGKLMIGAIAGGIHDPARRGAVEAITYDLATGKSTRATLHAGATEAERKLWFDDHNSPAFAIRPDGRIVSMYALHGRDEKIYYRISAAPGDGTRWQDERVYIPSASSRVTYSNLHLLRGENGGQGRLYNFFRGLDNSFKPSWMYSDDFGDSWTTGGILIDVPTEFKHRPYVKYASDGGDAVHFAYTEGHPRNFDNSIYHAYYRDGKLHRSDGTVIRSLKEGLKRPEEGTLVFKGDAGNVAWISDLHLDAQGRPYLAYSVQKDSGPGVPDERIGQDHRYRYARWNGSRWTDHEVAYAGTRVYRGEDDYTGLIALDPHDPDHMYISTNADPVTGKPLISAADGQRHWEVYEGRTANGGASWTWTPVTRDSTADNLRPIVPIWPGDKVALLWLRGKMRAYTDYDFEIVGMVGDRR
jgi:reactive intermediate/imine deaminase